MKFNMIFFLIFFVFQGFLFAQSLFVRTYCPASRAKEMTREKSRSVAPTPDAKAQNQDQQLQKAVELLLEQVKK